MAKAKRKSKKDNSQKQIAKTRPSFSISDRAQDYIFLGVLMLILIFLLKPLVIDGLSPQGVDVVGSKGKNHQVVEYNRSHDDRALWNPYVFAGMPEYHIYNARAYSFDTFLAKLSSYFSATFIHYLFAAIGMFLLLRYLKFSPFIAFISAVIFILIPHYKSLWMEGHFKKFYAVLYLPWILLAFKYFLNKRSVLSAMLFALAFGIQIRTQHYQIVFYTGLLIFSIGVYPFIKDLIEKKYTLFIKSTSLLIIGLALSILMSAQPLFLAKEYLPYSKRGKTTIDINKDTSQNAESSKSSGVSIEYATRWSTHPSELFTWIVPGFYGGMSGEEYHGSKVPQARGQLIASYWGYMPFTQSYEYIGVLVLLLALIGVYKYWEKPFIKGLVIYAVFLILLSFGRHFMIFYELAYNYIPFFDKFRSPMMSVTITFFILSILAGYGLFYLASLATNREDLKKHKDILYILGGFFALGVLIWLFGQGFSFVKEVGERYQGQSLELIKVIREEMFNADMMRYFIIVLLSAGILVAYLLRKINFTIFTGAVALIIIIDLINIQSRVNKKFINIKTLEKQYFQKTPTDNFLLNDSEKYRIFPLGNLLTDNRWAYYHQTIGGYTPIKMYVIEELVENNIYNGWDKNLPINWNILKILDVKYVISQQQLNNENLTLVNTDQINKLFVYLFNNHLQRGFFVEDYVIIKDEIERIKTINSREFDPGKTAIVEVEIPQQVSKPDSSYSRWVDFTPNLSKFEVYTDKQALFVISEVDYPPGWKYYLDGTLKNDIYKTDHAIQSVVVPEGRHTVELRFEPDSFTKDLRLSYASVSIIYLIIMVSLVIENRNKFLSIINKK